MYLSLQFIGGGRRAGVEIEVITTMCNLSFLVERLISGNRSLASVDSLRCPAEAEAENRTRAHQDQDSKVLTFISTASSVQCCTLRSNLFWNSILIFRADIGIGGSKDKK